MSFNKQKVDPNLGKKIHDYLVSLGVETPIVTNTLSRADKIDLIETKFKDIMVALGLDVSDDSLIETPKRVAKMFVNETMWGLDYEAFPKCTTVENKMGYDEMVCETATIKSLCEHHILPITGVATIAYIPNKKVLGLSKMPRIAEYFSRRPQIQERLTEQIFHALEYVLETDAIAVLIKANHQCVSLRGVEDTNAYTITSKLGAPFKCNDGLRAEFMSLARQN